MSTRDYVMAVLVALAVWTAGDWVFGIQSDSPFADRLFFGGGVAWYLWACHRRAIARGGAS